MPARLTLLQSAMVGGTRQDGNIEKSSNNSKISRIIFIDFIMMHHPLRSDFYVNA
jgi:hypothetical protein